MKEFQKFAVHLAERSAEVIRPYFRTDFTVDSKGDASPVTIADKKAEEVMRELIMKEYPQHGIMGEEFGSHNPDAEYTWVLDPIDGTLSFVCGVAIFGTLIALLKNGQPILGIINQPINREMVVGSEEETTFNGEKVKIRQCARLEDACLLCTDPYLVMENQNFEAFESLRHRVKFYRGLGDCYGYLLLVVGAVDIMIDPIMHPWDIMALIPVVRGAGGIITDFHGGDPVQADSIVATGPSIHSDVMSFLNPA
jgi:myo-inositol-1(or 4)-monophosphatase